MYIYLYVYIYIHIYKTVKTTQCPLRLTFMKSNVHLTRVLILVDPAWDVGSNEVIFLDMCICLYGWQGLNPATSCMFR